MLNDLERLQNEALEELNKAGSLQDIEQFSVAYLGRKEGRLTSILRNLASLPDPEKRQLGQAANNLRTLLEGRIAEKKKILEQATFNEKIQHEQVDVTLPGFPFKRGHAHPILRAIRDISAIFKEIGFEIVEGPDIETDFNNFTALNIPPDHPARDLQDTFYIARKEFKENAGPTLLRTHTSPVQIRLMQSVKPPVRVIAPGRVYRHEATDATHAAVFHQVEGLAVDRDISFADLKGTLTYFSQKYFGSERKVRFRPGYFPFVEPGAEMDLQCFHCNGKKTLPTGDNCPVCKATGWLEMLGAGMVHPQVLRNVGYDPAAYTGFAFGMGIERIVMTRYQVRDIRSFLESSLDFLERF